MRTIVGWFFDREDIKKTWIKDCCAYLYLCICSIICNIFLFLIILIFPSFILLFIYLFPLAASCHQKQKELLHMSFRLIWMIFYLKRHPLRRLLKRILYTHPHSTFSCTETQIMFKDFSFFLNIFASSFCTLK